MKKLSAFFYRILKFSYRYPVWVISGFSLAFAVAIYFCTQVKTVYDIQDTIGPDFATYESLESLRTEFQRRHNLTLLLSRTDNTELSADDHCHIRSYFSNLTLNSMDVVQKLESIYDLRTIQLTNKGYKYPSLLGLNCESNPPSIDPGWRNSVKNSPWRNILSGNEINDVIVDIFLQNDTTPEKTKEFLTKIQNDFPKDKYHVDFTGTGAFQMYVNEGYMQSQLLNLIIAVILLLTFKIFFGGFKSGFILIFSLLYTTVIVTGLMGALNYPIDFLTQSVFTIMTIATLEDFIFVVFLRQRKGHHWKASYRKIIVASFFTSLTTFIGFISLVTSDLEIIKRFGIVTAIGCLIEWAVVFMLLPAIEQKFSLLRLRSNIPKMDLSTQFLNRLESWHPGRALTLLLSLFFITWIPGSQNLVTNDSPSKVFQKEHPFMTSLNRIKSDRGWEAQVSVLFKDFDSIKDSPNIVQKLKTLPIVKAVENPIDVTNFYLQKMPSHLHSLIKSEIEDSFYFKKFLSPKSMGQIVLYVSESEIKAIRDLQTEVNKICGDKCELANGLVSYTEFGERVPRTLYESMVSGLILIAFILVALAFLTNTDGVIAILLSSFWGPCFVITVMWFTNVNVNYTTCIFASICLGLAGDNAIQYMFTSRKNKLSEKVSELSQPTIIMSLLLMAIPLTLTLSYFINMAELGILFFFGMMSNLFGDLFLLKSYLRLFNKPDTR